MVKYSKEQEERNKAFLSSVRKGVSNERIFKKKPKVAMDKVQKDIPVKYSNDVVVQVYIQYSRRGGGEDFN